LANHVIPLEQTSANQRRLRQTSSQFRKDEEGKIFFRRRSKIYLFLLVMSRQNNDLHLPSQYLADARSTFRLPHDALAVKTSVAQNDAPDFDKPADTGFDFADVGAAAQPAFHGTAPPHRPTHQMIARLIGRRLPIVSGWQGDSADDFRIRLGRSGSLGTRADGRSQPFEKQVQAAVRRAGGNLNRIGGSAGREAGGSMPEAGAPSFPSPRTAPDGSGIPPGGSDHGGSSSRRGSSSSIPSAGRADRRCGARQARRPTPIWVISDGTG
jgi:hypothetical protein